VLSEPGVQMISLVEHVFYDVDV